MDKVKRILPVALIVLLLLGGVGAAFAWGPPWSRGPFPPVYRIAPFSRFAARLNLSQKQINKLQDLRLKYEKEILTLRNSLQATRLELQSLLISSQPDVNKINLKVEKIGKLSTDIWKKTVHYLLAVKKVLTPEQWNKFLFYRYFGGGGYKK